jgi:hypothetical protein
LQDKQVFPGLRDAAARWPGSLLDDALERENLIVKETLRLIFFVCQIVPRVDPNIGMQCKHCWCATDVSIESGVVGGTVA